MTAVQQGKINVVILAENGSRTAARLPFFQGKVQRKQMEIANEAATSSETEAAL